MEASTGPSRVTLDGQLTDYWLREAARLDTLAAEARFGWQRRRYLRKAGQARAQAERSATREAARSGGGIASPAESSRG